MINNRRPFFEICRLFTLLMLVCVLAKPVHAQVIPAPVVTIDGADATAAGLIQQKITSLLASVNAYGRENTDTFANEPGSAALKNLIRSHFFTAVYDSLNPILIPVGTAQLEARRVFLKAAGGGLFGPQEVVLTFNKSGSLQNARLVAGEFSPDLMLSSQLYVEESEREQVQKAVQTFANAFMNKDSRALGSLLAKDAVMLSSSTGKVTGRTEYSRLDLEGFLKRTRERTFASRDDLQLQFEDLKVYAHPDIRFIFGVTAKQTLTTSRFTDVGYVFFSVDLRGKNPVFKVRYWQEKPFPEFTMPDELKPVKRKFAFRMEDVLENDSTRKLPSNEGTIRLKLISNNTEPGFTAKNVAGWLNTGLLSFQGVELFAEEATLLDSVTVQVPFAVSAQEFVQQVRVDLSFKESPTINAYTRNVGLYPMRETVFSMYLGDPGQKMKDRADVSVIGTIALITNVRQAEVVLFDKKGNRITGQLGDETNRVFISLLEGDYAMEVSKEGHETVKKDVSVYRDGTSRQEAYLARLTAVPLAAAVKGKKPVKKSAPADSTAVKPVKTPPRKEESNDDDEEEGELTGTRITANRYQWWIYGGTVLLISATIWMNSGSPANGGIPTPPAPPAAR